MSQTVLRVENLGKKYVLNHSQNQLMENHTLCDAMAQHGRDLVRRLKFRQQQFRQQQFRQQCASSPAQEEFWALRDVSFEIKQGDRIGIIGRNGAGKSTLLKILSRITEPSTGCVRIRGRVSSLLEVGTGFHAELTGRENIYLNGAILGMGRSEITRKFDEIIAFAEVEKFLDTPVKHYSSGMYVRLAFAVAAHLEPEILIVDEVLAVGDIQFQKKCLGKMQSVAESEGRTILFVSHNMNAMQRLCSHSLILERGKLIDYGDTTRMILRYTASGAEQSPANEWIDVSHVSRSGTQQAQFVGIKYTIPQPTALVQSAEYLHPYSGGGIDFFLKIVSDELREINSLAVVLYDRGGTKLINADTIALGRVITLKKGENLVGLSIKSLHLNPDIYVLGLWLASRDRGIVFDHIESTFEMEVINIKSEGFGMKPDFDGAVTCEFKLLE